MVCMMNTRFITVICKGNIDCAVLCLGQDFWGTQESLYLNFRGTFTNSGDIKSFKFLPVKLNSYPEISVHSFV